MAGIGIEDNERHIDRLVHSKKSFGVRAAIDLLASPDGKNNG